MRTSHTQKSTTVQRTVVCHTPQVCTAAWQPENARTLYDTSSSCWYIGLFLILATPLQNPMNSSAQLLSQIITTNTFVSAFQTSQNLIPKFPAHVGICSPLSVMPKNIRTLVDTSIQISHYSKTLQRSHCTLRFLQFISGTSILTFIPCKLEYSFHRSTIPCVWLGGWVGGWVGEWVGGWGGAGGGGGGGVWKRSYQNKWNKHAVIPSSGEWKSRFLVLSF